MKSRWKAPRLEGEMWDEGNSGHDRVVESNEGMIIAVLCPSEFEDANAKLLAGAKQLAEASLSLIEAFEDPNDYNYPEGRFERALSGLRASIVRCGYIPTDWPAARRLSTEGR